jgi:hypothetical protein
MIPKYNCYCTSLYLVCRGALFQCLLCYAHWLKAQYKIVGGIFQGRYKSTLVEEDRDSLKLSASVHLNPVSSGFIVSKNKEDAIRLKEILEGKMKS